MSIESSASRTVAASDRETVSDTRQTAGHDAYRFQHLTTAMVLRDLGFGRDDPAPGDHLPDFDLQMLGGGTLRRADLLSRGPSLLVFGSSTCPVTDSAAPGLNALHVQYGRQINFLLINVREAHPGAAIPQPESMPEKVRHAARLRELHQFGFSVAVDDLEGTFHRVMSPKPNSAYIVDPDGTIRFRALWANDTRALAAALEETAHGRTPTPSQSGGLVRAPLKMVTSVAPVLDRAGKGAWRDMFRAAPPIAVAAWTLKSLGIGMGSHTNGAQHR